MAAFTALFGNELVTKNGLQSTESVLGGKAGVLVYFSAHWCPPCRGFTPKLAEFHKKHAEAKHFETVFVSGDKNQEAFNEYYGEMPWAALPFDKSDLKAALEKKYKVQGIPSLVILGPDGSLSTKDGRSAVMEDFEEAAGFPWKPKQFKEALGSKFMKQDGSLVGLEAIEGKTLGLYFSAHWCPPCRGFTPQLKEFYSEMKAKDPNFEIIFVSSDKEEGGMMSYFKEDHGDYLALPYSDRTAKNDLSKIFEVQGIPTFAVVDSAGKILNANARAKVSAGAEVVLADGWAPPAVGDMAQGPEAAGTDINETPTVVVLCDKAPTEVQKSVVPALTPLAQKYIDEAEKSEDDVKYIFLVAKGGGPLEQIKALTKKDAAEEVDGAGDAPVMILFDIPDNGGFYVSSEHNITTENVAKFLADKESGVLTRKQLGR
jgi:nucleoredoxin